MIFFRATAGLSLLLTLFIACTPGERVVQTKTYKGMRVTQVYGGQLHLSPSHILFTLKESHDGGFVLSNKDFNRENSALIKIRQKGIKQQRILCNLESMKVIDSAFNEKTISLSIPADQYVSLAIESPVKSTVSKKHKTEQIEVNVSDGDILHARQNLLFIRNHIDGAQITIANRSKLQQKLIISVDNIREDTEVNANKLDIKKLPMPHGIKRFQIQLAPQSHGQLSFSSPTPKYPISIVAGGNIKGNLKALRSLLHNVRSKLSNITTFMLLGNYTHYNFSHEYYQVFKTLNKLDAQWIFHHGMHDDELQGSQHYTKQFGSLAESYDIGPIFIACLNNESVFLKQQELQQLKADLQTTAAKYKIVVLKSSIFSKPSALPELKKQADSLLSLAEEHEVDFVLSANIAGYIEYQHRDTLFINSGGAGADFVPYDSSTDFTLAFKKHLLHLTFFEDRVEKKLLPFIMQ